MLLAIPHFIIVSIFQAGVGCSSVGLTFILVLVAGVGLLFIGRYPRGIFDLVMGRNR